MDEIELLRPKSIYVNHFLFGTFLDLAFIESRCIFAFGNFFKFILFTRYLYIKHFCYILFAHISRLVCFLCIQFFIYRFALSTDVLVEFSFVILEDNALFVFLGAISISFESLFYR